VEYFEATGEAAFYGPKADFMARDVLGREWQLSTIQVDFIQPSRLGCIYIGEDNEEHTPVVLHRAVTGTTERFMAVIIEHFAGAFPVWLSPVQAILIPIADRHMDFCKDMATKLKGEGLRVEVDERSERMNSKIRDAQKQKIPYMLVVGDQEMENNQIALRLRNGENPGPMSMADFLSRAKKDIEAGD
jgi:threonyl-tRNA synthetase